MNKIAEEVKSIVSGHLEDAPMSLDEDTDLKQLGLSSLKMVSLLVEIESRFLIEFPSNMMSINNFRTIRTISEGIYKVMKVNSETKDSGNE